MKLLSVLTAAIGLAAVFPNSNSLAQDHGHLNIGAAGTSQDDPLLFENGSIFGTNSGFVLTLIKTNSGPYAGYYHGNITLTGLPATPAHGGPVPDAAAPGSRIFAQLVSVDGPVGGLFSFWEDDATSPTISLASGAIGTNVWLVSENDGSPGSDPYGHIHGRRFTATMPGIYLVTLRALDLSTNGAGGGPIHGPSETLTIYFQAGINIKTLTMDVDGTHVVFGAKLGFDWQLEASDALPGTNWTAIGGPISGNDQFVEALDNQPPGTARFYRVRNTP